MEKSSKLGNSKLEKVNTHSNKASFAVAAETVETTEDISARAHEAPLVSGSLWNAIWVMSWPLLAATTATSVIGLVDVQVAGRLGAASQAAVGLAEQIIFILQVFLMSVGVGTTAIVSRAYGKKDLADADFATAQSLSLSLLVGLALTVAAILTAHFVVPLFSAAPDVQAESNLYLTVFALYLVPFSLVCIANAAFRGIGNARIPLVIICTEVVINIAGDYLTVVYNWPIPGLGVRGIAASAVAGSLIASILAIVFVSRSPLRTSLKQLLPLSASVLKRIVDIGVPAAMQRLSWAFSVLGLFFVLSNVVYPTAALAAWTIGMRIEGLLFMPEMALSMAVSSIVGQNLGAGRHDRAFSAGWAVSGIAACSMGTVAVGIFVFAHQLALMMCAHDPATIECTTSYLQINAVGAVGQAINSVLSGALQGAGDTKVTMWISIVSHWTIKLPLAWILSVCMGMGANSVWVAMAASATISAIAVAVRFQTGGWANRKV
ncbi:MAG: MATE family efflux transporter [Candidatus Melainabacteria bacterium]|nr:MATE family efflux transporter [Candidatus Melainabacteria bacterium]